MVRPYVGWLILFNLLCLLLQRLVSPHNHFLDLILFSSSPFCPSAGSLDERLNELLGGGLLGHLEDLDLGGRHGRGQRLEQLAQRVHLDGAANLGGGGRDGREVPGMLDQNKTRKVENASNNKK